MNIKQWRKANKLTQKEVADYCGAKSSMTVSYWEKKGVTNTATIEKLQKMSCWKITDFGAAE